MRQGETGEEGKVREARHQPATARGRVRGQPVTRIQRAGSGMRGGAAVSCSPQTSAARCIECDGVAIVQVLAPNETRVESDSTERYFMNVSTFEVRAFCRLSTLTWRRHLPVACE